MIPAILPSSERELEEVLIMAKGKKCPQCGYQMYAQREDHQPQGTWVYYVCRSEKCKFTEKVFEAKR